MTKSADAFRTISEVAEELDLPQHVLRFWETRFPQLKPLKRAGGRRFYRPADIRLLTAIRQLLYGQGYTIKGVQRLLKEQGAKGLLGGAGSGEWPLPEEAVPDDTAPDETGDPNDDESDASSLVLTQAPSLPSRAAGLTAPERDLLVGALDIIVECQDILRGLRS